MTTRATMTVELKNGVRIPAELITPVGATIMVKTSKEGQFYFPSEIVAVIFGEEKDA